MAQLSDVEKRLRDERGQNVPRPAPSIERARASNEPVVLYPARQREANPPSRPFWHKDNYGFWLAVCVLISLVFSVIYRSIG